MSSKIKYSTLKNCIEKRIVFITNLPIVPKKQNVLKEKKFSRIAYLDRKDFFFRQLNNKIKNEN